MLISRNEEAGARLADELGENARFCAADVAKESELKKCANEAIAAFGGFDTWINNAGVSIYGNLEDVPEEDSRRLFDTNFWGTVNGSLIAAKHLHGRGG